MRILLLEDQPALLASTKKGLEEMGFGVDAFGDGDAAMQRALDTPYDALVLDIMVPGRDGLSILRALRERRDSVPVILVTARAALPEKIEGLNLGADDYLTKPFFVEDRRAPAHRGPAARWRTGAPAAGGGSDTRSARPQSHARQRGVGAVRARI